MKMCPSMIMIDGWHGGGINNQSCLSIINTCQTLMDAIVYWVNTSNRTTYSPVTLYHSYRMFLDIIKINVPTKFW